MHFRYEAKRHSIADSEIAGIPHIVALWMGSRLSPF